MMPPRSLDAPGANVPLGNSSTSGARPLARSTIATRPGARHSSVAITAMAPSPTVTTRLVVASPAERRVLNRVLKSWPLVRTGDTTENDGETKEQVRPLE